MPHDQPKGGLAMMMNMGPPPEKKKPSDDKGAFMPPDSLKPPDDKQPGETFDATTKYRIEDDGKWCPVSVNGVPLEEESPEEDQGEAPLEEEPAPPNATSTMSAALAQHRAQGQAI